MGERDETNTLGAPVGDSEAGEERAGERRGVRSLAHRAARPAAVVAALALVAVAAWAAFAFASDDDATPRAASRTATATVTRRNLVARDTFEGSLGFADLRPLASALAGTITNLPREGDVVGRGGVLYRVNGMPVVLLYGSHPLWRTLAEGVEGEDVRQLEKNLVALGYDPDGDIEIDREFDWATEAAVERWQDDLGVTEDGTVEPDEAVFLPGPRRIGELKTALGSQIGTGATVMDTSATRRIVTVDLDARRQTLVRQGQSVRIKMPNGRAVRGRIADVGKVAETNGEGGTPTIEVTITVPNARATGNLDQAPVDVAIARETRRNVLTVPVTALLALAGGGYAVEVADGDNTRLVRVRPGLFADGLVEITGEGIRAGTKVVIPE
jgi:peptidoglycan hydrolase-like protein with peptidoglycan-binding domain